MLPAVRPGTHARPPASSRRKVGMTSSHHAPYVLGCTRATMAGTMGCHPAQWAATARAGANPQSRPQFGLEAATRLHEVGVASNRGSARRGECVPGPCTHRPSHHPSRLHPKSSAQPREGGAEGVVSFLGRITSSREDNMTDDPSIPRCLLRRALGRAVSGPRGTPPPYLESCIA